MKRILSGLWGIVQVLIIIYAIFITSCILCRDKFGFTEFGDYTIATINEERQSYLDNSKVGNLLIVKYSKDITKGDVIYYYAPTKEEYIIKSGVVASKVENAGTALYTLNDEDKTTIIDTRVLGKYANQYETWGQVLDILESRFGFLLLVLLPIMLVFIYQVYGFVMVLKFENEKEEIPPQQEPKEEPQNQAQPIQEEKKVESDIEIL